MHCCGSNMAANVATVDLTHIPDQPCLRALSLARGIHDTCLVQGQLDAAASYPNELQKDSWRAAIAGSSSAARRAMAGRQVNGPAQCAQTGA